VSSVDGLTGLGDKIKRVIIGKIKKSDYNLDCPASAARAGPFPPESLK